MCRPTCRSSQPSCTFNVNSDSIELPQLLTVSQFGHRLGVCRRTVERLIATQQVQSCKIGRSTRIAVAELVRYVASIQRTFSPRYVRECLLDVSIEAKEA